jgi:plastocyanin
MKRILLVPLAAVAALLIAAVAGANTQTVQITSSGFTPRSVTAAVGDTVTWHNADTASHQIVANNGTFASPVLKSGDTWSHTFSAPARVAYHDVSNAKTTGSVIVNGPSPSVSLTSEADTVIYGRGTTLDGATTSATANQSVTLSSQPYGAATASAQQKSTGTGADGSFSFDVSPSIQTTYVAHWNNTQSTPVTVNVAPQVGFGRSGRIYKAHVVSAINYKGHYVLLQRHRSLGWTTIKRVKLNSSNRASFLVRLPRGHSSLRLYLTSAQAGAGYVASHSRTISVKH